MPSVYNELCLACSGSAISGSQRQHCSANDRYRNSSSRSFLRSGPPPGLDSKTGTRSGALSRTESVKDDSGDASSTNVAVYEYEYECECEEMKVFRTSCCARPICAACLQANPRLARYVPCLACLGGVSAVEGSSSSSSSSASFSSQKTRNVDGSYKVGVMARKEEEDVNLNGALRDGDVFIIGGEDEGEDGRGNERAEDGRLSAPPPPYADSDSGTPNGKVAKSFQDPNTEPNPTPDLGKSLQKMDPIPGRHYIQKNDTLRGLALKYGVDGRTLCRLNKLPPTTLSTTPHLLHTRTVLDLPPSAKLPIPQMDDRRKQGYDPEREREIELERTAKRLQLVAKEADWEVARAYAVLAQSSSSTSSSSSDARRIQPPESRRYDNRGEKCGFDDETEKEKEKEKEKEDAKQDVTPQDRAVDAYLEDNAWEARERAAGRGPGSRRAR